MCTSDAEEKSIKTPHNFTFNINKTCSMTELTIIMMNKYIINAMFNT